MTFQMPHGHGYLNDALIEIAGRILRTPPEGFKILMTGEVEPSFEQHYPASHFLWDGCELDRPWPIQIARRLPDAAGLVVNLSNVRLIRYLPAHRCLAGGYEVWRGFQPYTMAP